MNGDVIFHYRVVTWNQVFCRSERPHLPDVDWSVAVSGPPADVGAHEGDEPWSGRRPRVSHGTCRNLRHRRHADRRQPLLSHVTCVQLRVKPLMKVLSDVWVSAGLCTELGHWPQLVRRMPDILQGSEATHFEDMLRTSVLLIRKCKGQILMVK